MSKSPTEQERTTTKSFIARQPIFSASNDLFGYELLFRNGFVNAFPDVCHEQASSKVIADSALVMDLDRLVQGRAFVNVTRDVLVNGYVELLPRVAVIELLETVRPDDQLIEACKRLRDAGYTIALDDFETSTELEPLVELADIIKVDFLTSALAECERVATEMKRRGKRLLAEKVESHEIVSDAAAMGYDLFQGFYFSKPEIVSANDVPSFKINMMRLLREIHRSDLDLDQLSEVIRQDLSLTYKLLRYINSASFGFLREITSIRHALVLLGANEVRKWATLMAATTISQDRPPELVRQALIRARFCESLASKFRLERRKQDLFLLGLFSLIDAMLGRPMDEILECLPLSHDLKDALGGRPSALVPVLDYVTTYERGEWATIAPEQATEEADVAQLYVSALEWGDESLGLVA